MNQKQLGGIGRFPKGFAQGFACFTQLVTKVELLFALQEHPWCMLASELCTCHSTPMPQPACYAQMPLICKCGQAIEDSETASHLDMMHALLHPIQTMQHIACVASLGVARAGHSHPRSHLQAQSTAFLRGLPRKLSGRKLPDR